MSVITAGGGLDVLSQRQPGARPASAGGRPRDRQRRFAVDARRHRALSLCKVVRMARTNCRAHFETLDTPENLWP